MRIKNRRWLFACGFHLLICTSFLQHVRAEEVLNNDAKQNNSSSSTSAVQAPKELHSIFSPRMDYDQWKPLGRGDPLKNDPTYDYVPPKLDRVHYWVDTSPRKPEPDPHKTEILVLGVSSKKSSAGGPASHVNSRTDYDTLLKFLDGTKLGNAAKNTFQRQRPHYSVPVTYFPSSSFYATAASSSSSSSSNKNRHQERIAYPKGEQRVPYTMLVPPPMPSAVRPPEMRPFKQQLLPVPVAAPATTTPPTQFVNASTEAPLTAQESKLVYQSSSLSLADDWQREKAPNPVTSYPIIWNSTIQKNKASPIPLVLAPESFMVKETYPKPSDNAIQISEVFDSTVTDQGDKPPMRKGQVTDESMDISNSYVNIGKPDAQIQTEIKSPETMLQPMMLLQQQQQQHPVQTMKPKPMTLHSMMMQMDMAAPITTFRPATLPYILSTTTTTTTTTTPPPPLPVATTTQATLTTDTLFKHYKQPAEPIKGPMYLIIQGHSKVKTYGPAKSVHGIRVQETNEIPTAEEEDRKAFTLQDHLRGEFLETRGGGGRQGKSLTETEKEEKSEVTERSQRLQTLNHALAAGLGAIGVPLDRKDNVEDIEWIQEERGRRSKSGAIDGEDVQETEVEVGFEVASGAQATTSERYYKGIVEAGEARKLN